MCLKNSFVCFKDLWLRCQLQTNDDWSGHRDADQRPEHSDRQLHLGPGSRGRGRDEREGRPSHRNVQPGGTSLRSLGRIFRKLRIEFLLLQQNQRNRILLNCLPISM